MASTIKVTNINTPDGTGNITVDRPLSGSGASLTALPAANLIGTLPAISGASLTNVVPADNSVTLAKMAGGTDGQIITYDASGDPVAVGPGTAGQVLTSAGANAPPTFAAAAGGVDGITTSANATAISITANEEVTMPKQPAFNAWLTGSIANATGDGTDYALTGAGSNWSAFFDTNADFNLGTGTFTAPVTGKYFFNVQVTWGNMSARDYFIYLKTNGTPSVVRGVYEGIGAQCSAQETAQKRDFSYITTLTASQTCYVSTQVSGGSKNIYINGGSAGYQTQFCGWLLG